MKKLTIEDLTETNNSENNLSFDKLLENKEKDLNRELDKKFGNGNEETYVKKFDIEGIELKDRTIETGSNIIDSYTLSPFKSSTSNTSESIFEIKSKAINIARRKEVNKNAILTLFIILLLSSSMFFNSVFLRSVDPILMKIVFSPIELVGSSIFAFRNLFFEIIKKPYVVTVGEYGNLAVAKDEAKKLLPQYKQINIKELDSGVYTFEIERLSSKKNAYKLARVLLKNNLNDVHVRYVP